jgi:excisionase family DNA binding protein
MPKHLDRLLARQVDQVVADLDRDLPRRALLTSGEVASALNVTPRTILRLAANRAILSVRVGGSRMFLRRAVLDFVRDCAVPAYPRMADYDDE